jgi:regulator of replication initiation timing
MASREAIDGLGNDLSSELVHASNGIITRYEAERASLQEEISDLRQSLARMLSGDATAIRRENEALHSALKTIPEFRLLESIQKNRRTSYDQLADITGFNKSKLRKLVKELVSRGYVGIDRNSKPHSMIFISSPWLENESQVQQTLEKHQVNVLLPNRTP